jgi:Ca2+-binding RTX toxin-like protein
VSGTVEGTITSVHGGGGDDHLIVTGGGGADSPLLLFGDTTQDGVFYTTRTGDLQGTGRVWTTGPGNNVIDARGADGMVIAYGGAGDDLIYGSAFGDHLAGGSGDDVIHGTGGANHIYGDAGFTMFDVFSRRGSARLSLLGEEFAFGLDTLLISEALFVINDVDDLRVLPRYAEVPADENLADHLEVTADLLLAPGDDVVFGGTGDDLIIGDYAVVTLNEGAIRLVTTGSVLRVETVRHAEGGDDVLFGGTGDDVIIGGPGADVIDGGLGDDLLLGDTVVLDRTDRVGDFTNPRYRLLDGATLYDGVDTHWQLPPGDSPWWGDFETTLVHDGLREDQNHADVIAGGGGNDMIFGQIGDDVLHGDGRVALVEDIDHVSGTVLTADPDLANRVAGWGGPFPASVDDGVVSFRGGTYRAWVLKLDGAVALDGNDYIEGGSGDNLIFGGLGQDDIIGGSSSLFGLDTPALRPVGSNVIYGGNADHWSRNQEHPDWASPHARDADVILGDNGNIYRIVVVTDQQTGTTAHPTFNHDCYLADGVTPSLGTCHDHERVVPRAVQLLDYSPTGGAGYWDGSFDPASPVWVEGPNTNLGAGDFIYTETGDNIVYGMTGDDVIFGGPGDDHLIGGEGHDVISGGTGNDAILGDDGRILTSRNGLAEPLYGIAAIPASELNKQITSPGNIQEATINRTGELNHAVRFADGPGRSGEHVPGRWQRHHLRRQGQRRDPRR